MAFISVTRLRIRSVFYLPQFIWHTLKSQRQVARATGFLGGRLMRDPGNAFWTVTAWEDEAAMRAYRGSGAHMKAMPRLLDWCDEASVVHWQQGSESPLAWPTAETQMRTQGRTSRVRNQSPAHSRGETVPPRL